MSKLSDLVGLVNDALKEQLAVISEKAIKSGRIKLLTGGDEYASATFSFAIEEDESDDCSLYFEVRINSDSYQYSTDDKGIFHMQHMFFGGRARAAMEHLPEDILARVNSSFDDVFVSMYVNGKMVYG